MSKFLRLLLKRYIPGNNISEEQDYDNNQIKSIEEIIDGIE